MLVFSNRIPLPIFYLSIIIARITGKERSMAHRHVRFGPTTVEYVWRDVDRSTAPSTCPGLMETRELHVSSMRARYTSNQDGIHEYSYGRPVGAWAASFAAQGAWCQYR